MGTNLNVSGSWFKTRFGNFLQKFDSRSCALVNHPTENVFGENQNGNCEDTNVDEKDQNVIGLYVVPVSDTEIRYLNDDITQDLKELYWRLNENTEEPGRQRFEVVQVCFPQKIPNVNFALNDNLKKEFENRIMDVPWFALPFDSIERNIRIRHNYGVRDGEFALVLLDRMTGELITKQGHDRLLRDKDGLQFPWIPPQVLHVLENIPQYVSLSQNGSENCHRSQSRDRTTLSFHDIDKKAILGLYFSAYWCPPCKAFTSQLIKTYATVKERGYKFEIIFVSSDRSADSYEHYVSTMPWLAIPYADDAGRAQLTTLYGIQGIPTLILLNPDGSLITEDGRGEINDDPHGTNFPWFPKPVNILTPRLVSKLQKNPAVVLFIDGEEDGEIELATAVLTPVSECVQKKYNETLLFFIATDSDTGENVREFLRLEDVSPLLTLADISLGRFTVMEYGKEITEQTIMNFVHRFYNNELIFLPIERFV